MPSASKVASSDAFVKEPYPSESSGSDQRLVLNGTTGLRRFSYIYFDVPDAMRRGVTVRAATLSLYAAASYAGGGSLIVERITASWKERTLDWDNAPAITTTNSVTVTLPALTSGQVFTVDVPGIYQNVAGGGDYFGLRVRITASAYVRFHSSESTSSGKRPQLDLTWAYVPRPPVDLFPSGSRSVTASKPNLRWRFRDVFGDTTQARSRVEILNSSSGASIYDSGWVDNTEEQFDMANPPSGAPAVPALTSGVAVDWRVTVEDGDGLRSDASDFVTFTYDSPGVLTLTSPPGSTVNDLTPPITWTFTGRTQRFIELFIDEWDDDHQRWNQIWHFPRKVYTAGSITLPADVIHTKTDYRGRLRVWDNLGREEQQGYVNVVFVFHYVKDSTPASPQTFVATTDVTPAVTFTWANPTAGRPDWFRLWEDDKVAVSHIDPDDVATSPGATTYELKWYGATPRTSHVYELAAVVSSGGVKRESAPVTQTVTPDPMGVWLLDSDGDTRVFMAGQDSLEEQIGESGTTYNPVGKRAPTRIIDSIRGYEGTWSGRLIDFNGVTAKTYKARLLKIKGKLFTDTCYLVIGDRSLPILLEEVSVSPAPPDGAIYDVSIAYRQIAEFFEVVS